MTRHDDTDQALVKINRGGRPPAFKPAHVQILLDIVAARPQASLDEIANELYRRIGLSVCTATIRRRLRAHGIVRLKTKRRPYTPAQAGKRYGYTRAHRREQLTPYSTDLTDAEWVLVADLFERNTGTRGAPPRYPRRELVNACCYVLRTGCAWRLLPKTFAPWQAVYKSFTRWVEAGTFEAMQDRLREQWRLRMGRSAQPTATVIDAQSTRASPQGGRSGFDAGKKIKGRKRNLIVDTLGVVVAVTVTAASVQDRDAAAAVVQQACSKAPCIQKLYTDGAYGGRSARAIEDTQGILVEVVRRPGNGTTGTLQAIQHASPAQASTGSGFTVLPKRWVVERTHAWIERWRRTIMHHDRKLSVAAAWVWLATARILLNRLA